MALPTFTVPSYYSADLAYKAVSGIRSYLQSTVALLGTPQNAMVVKGIFDQLKLYKLKLREPHDAGLLDGDATWKQIVIDTWVELDSLVAASASIEEEYTKQAAQAVEAAANANSIIKLETAAAGITVSPAHHTAMINALNTSLGA